MQSIGDRMKENYEFPAKHMLTRKVPVIVRVDGKAFHTLTKYIEKPYSTKFIKTMEDSAMEVGRNLQGFQMAYVQSDEASFLLTDYDTHQTEPAFGYNKSKLESISASMMGSNFTTRWGIGLTPAYFDGRAFNIPREEVANYFLWRALDWNRNSINMLAQSEFSHKDLQGVGTKEAKELLLERRGIRWEDYPPQIKNGTFITKYNGTKYTVRPTYRAIAELIDGVI